jgi:hypothetical protein
MKNFLSGILCILIITTLLYGCRKDYAREHFSEEVPSIKPDLTVKIQTDVSGFVVDENNKPVFRAAVVAGNKTATTDEYGYFHITGASLPEIAGFVKVSKNGYFTGYKTFLAEEGGKAFVRLKLLPVNNPGDIDAGTGGAIDLGGGARLSIPSNAVVIASSGAAYTGTINVSAHYIDPTTIQAAQLQSPGDTRGVDDEGYLRLLNTYSTLAVELTDNTGQRLQIATGKQATITMPVPSSLAGSAPATIKLWSFDESNGLWKQESTATKNGNTYTGTVSHFSFWTGAVAIPLVQFSVRIVNTALQPLANIAVGIRGAAEPFNAGFGRFGFTDADGYVSGAIPANTQLVLNVLTPCETEAYSHPFNSGSSDIDMGTLTGNLGQGMVTITGNAIDCSSQPVINGYVQTYDNGFYNRINIVNGSFSFSGISTVSSISFTIDGVTDTMIEPADELMSVFNSQSADWTTVLKINNPSFNFQFSGPAATSGIHQVAEVFGPGFVSGRAYAPVPLTVTVTEFGIPGGFIAGTFSGMMLDFTTSQVYNVNCGFRVRRHQ